MVNGCIFFAISGCGKQQGEGFVGHWVSSDPKVNASIDIRRDGEVFHLDHNYHALWKGPDVIDVERMEGSAISENVLRVGAGLGSIDVRLDEGKIYLYGDGFSKSK